MNVERILMVADAIENHSILGLGFNMADLISRTEGIRDQSGQGCGTVACIAGWSMVLQHDLKTGNQAVEAYTQSDSTSMMMCKSAEWLGLTKESANELFLAYGSGCSLDSITPEDAVVVLRRLAATGKVDWRIEL